MNISTDIKAFIEKTEPVLRELSRWIEMQEHTLGIELNDEEIDRKKIEFFKTHGLTKIYPEYSAP